MTENGLDCTSDALERLIDELTTDQIRFVVARQEFASDKEAAEHIRVSPRTVKDWKAKGVPIDDAVRMMAADGLVVATRLRRRNLAKAMAVKIAGLDSNREPIRQAVATEIIEWEMGKATQKQEVSGPDGGPIQTATSVDYSSLSDDELCAIIARRSRNGTGEPNAG